MDKKELKDVEQENKKFKLIDLIKNKRYYAILNLTFYSILIIVLIIGVRSTNNGNNNLLNNNLNNSADTTTIVEGFQSIKDKNFEFIYTFQKDDEKITYEGKQNSNKIYFKSLENSKEYMMQDNIVLEKKEGEYVLADTPVQYFNYLDVDLVEQILSKLRKDENDYVLSLNDFVAVITDNWEITVEYPDDDILVEIKKQNNIITELVFDITGFVKLKEASIDNVKLYLQFKNFGLVEDFQIKS